MVTMAYTPRTFYKDGETVVADSAVEDIQLLWEGWTPGGPAPERPPFSQRELTALNAAYAAGDDKIIYVGPGGNDAWSGLTDSRPKLTLAAALTEMGTGVKGQIRMLPGDIDAGSGVSWTGYKCGLVGAGPLATRIVTTAQSGPAIDMTGVNYDLNGVDVGGFTIYGDGAATPTNHGLALDPNTSIVLAWFHDITVRNVGGTPFSLGYTELTSFDRLIAYSPMSVQTDDVPYISGIGAFNGNTFRDCQLHGDPSLPAGRNVGPSGAIVIADNGATAPHDNKLDTFKLEYLILPTDGTVVHMAGNASVLTDPQFFDCSKVSGATGTSYVRFSTPVAGNLGGNLYTGVVMGKGTNATDVDTGIDMRQNGNRITGTKGYRGYNVTLASGCQRLHSDIGGSVATASDPTYVDNSGQTNNTLLDRYGHSVVRPATTYKQGSTSATMDIPGGAWGAGGVRFSDPATPANGTVGIGTSGARFQAVGPLVYPTADTWRFRKIDLTNLVEITSTGVKGVRLYDSGALPAASLAYRGVIANLQGAAGVADRLVICRKDAADAYAWVDLF